MGRLRRKDSISSLTRNSVSDIENEVRILEKLKHENVIRLIEARKEEDDMEYIVLEHCEGGTLQELIEKRTLRESEAKNVFL